MHPRHLKIEDFTYNLPDNRIARHPLPGRDTAKLLVYKDGNMREDVFRNLAYHLPADAQIVFNQTKVVQARLIFHKSSGAKIELFCLEADARYADVAIAFSQKGEVYWNCMVGGGAKWKEGIVLEMKDGDLQLYATAISRSPGKWAIHLSWNDAAKTFAEILQQLGKVPLPPYINRAATSNDASEYQTVFAKDEGSVAAPTASLHFTKELLQALEDKGIGQSQVTLHVGAGTFLPVKSHTLDGHAMHSEWIEIDAAAVDMLKKRNGPLIASGTTALRTLETLYWIGCRILRDPKITDLAITQWEPYESTDHFSSEDALAAVSAWLQRQGKQRLITKTGILIAPGYRFRLVDGLITNFHQPQSTLLLLVSAFIGDDWRRVYDYALENNFRFLSYGDGSLLWRKGGTFAVRE